MGSSEQQAKHHATVGVMMEKELYSNQYIIMSSPEFFNWQKFTLADQIGSWWWNEKLGPTSYTRHYLMWGDKKLAKEKKKHEGEKRAIDWHAYDFAKMHQFITGGGQIKLWDGKTKEELTQCLSEMEIIERQREEFDIEACDTCGACWGMPEEERERLSRIRAEIRAAVDSKEKENEEPNTSDMLEIVLKEEEIKVEKEEDYDNS